MRHDIEPHPPGTPSVASREPPLAIRFASADDAAAVAAIYAPSIIDSAISFEAEVPSTNEMRERIETTLERTPWLVCEHDGVVVGYAYASSHSERAAYRWSLNASVYIAASCRRQGVGRALYTSLFALARLAGYYAVHAGITLPNAPSVGIHEALGFERVGVYRSVGFKLGAWRDVGWWQLELRPREGIPAPTIPLPALRAESQAAVEAALAAGLAPREAHEPA